MFRGFLFEGDTMAPPVDPAAIRRDRLNILLPQAMKPHDVDMWLVSTRENAEDPLLPTLGLTHIVARGAFVFMRRADGTVRKVAIAASYDVEPIERSELYDQVIPYRKEGVKPHLAALVHEADPRRIAINTSRDETVADGLTVGMRDYLEEALGAELTRRFVSAEGLVVSLLGRKLPQEIQALRTAVESSQRILAEALSAEVVRPGVTTEKDLDAFMARRAAEMGCGVAFSSIVVGPSRGHTNPTDRVIGAGDVIRIDWGATYQGYAADIQRTAYVLRPGESAAPTWLQRLWDDTLEANRAAVAACRPGQPGVAVDRAGREE